jgi:TonB family protein
MRNESREHKPQSWEHLLEEDPHGGTGFRLGIVAAVFIHAGIFAVTWPTIAQAPPEAPEQMFVRVPIHNYVPERPEPEPIIELEPPLEQHDATLILPGPPPEDSGEPIEREVFEPPITGPAIHVIPVDPPDPPPDPPVDTGHPMRLFQPPKAVHKVQPVYTESARKACVKGVVILELVIDTQGAVESVKVLRGLPLGLTESAVRAAEQWRFEPCVFNDRPTAVRFVLTVSFNLT